MAGKRHMPLSENHERAVATTLTILDERLCEFEEIAGGRQLRSILHQEVNDFSRAQRAEMMREIVLARQAVRELSHALRLRPRVESLSRRVRGASSSLWESLLDTQSKRLRGYGEVPSALADYLDPRIDQLVAQVEHIAEIAGRNEGALDEGTEATDGRETQEGEQARS
jgi:hypothetical protein